MDERNSRENEKKNEIKCLKRHRQSPRVSNQQHQTNYPPQPFTILCINAMKLIAVDFFWFFELVR